MPQSVARKVLSLGIRVMFVAGTAAVSGAADYYKLPHIRRIERDLYRSADVLIETHSCLHLAAGEGALLKYKGPGDYTQRDTANELLHTNQIPNANRWQHPPADLGAAASSEVTPPHFSNTN